MEEQLIDSVRAYHCIWNVSHPMYKDRNAKREAWRRIAVRLCQSEEELMKKWKYLKDKYVRELKKVMKKISGDPGPQYVSRWPFFELLGFVKESVAHRRTTSNMDSQADSNEDLRQQDEDSQKGRDNGDDGDEREREDDDSIAGLVDLLTGENDLEEPSTPSSESTSSAQQVARQVVKRKRGNEDPLDAAIAASMAAMAEVRQGMATQKEETEEVSFGKSVAGTLERLSPAQKAWAKMKIQEVLFNAEFGQMNCQQ